MTQRKREATVRRARTALATILILLLLLLAAVSYVLVGVIVPRGGATADSTPTGMTWVRSIYGYGSGEDDQLYRPTDVAIGPDGVIWVTDPQRSRVLAFNPDGTYKSMLHQGPAFSGDDAMVRPNAVDVDEDGLIYVADYGRESLMIFSEANELLRETEIPLPVEVAVSDDRIVVGSVYGFAILNKQGEVIRTVGTRGSGPDQFDVVRGIVMDEAGTIYIVDTYNNRVRAFDRDGEEIWSRTTGNPGNAASASDSTTSGATLSLPSGMTMDGNGRLVVADAFNFGLAVLNGADGAILAQYGEAGADDGSFAYPSGVDYDPARDWFAVADTTNDRVQIVTIDGSGGGVIEAGRRLMSGLARICIIPLVLMVVILVLVFATRRARRADSVTSGTDVEFSSDVE